MPKINNTLKCLITGLIMTNALLSSACTIFMANDGQHVWIGNNEDELQRVKYRIWYYPAQKKGFGYAIWTELSFGSLFNGFSYLNPQGGLNEYGLFMDYTTITPTQVTRSEQKQDRKKQVVTALLKKCRTVEEALAYLGQFNLIKLNEAQLFIADASGDYATVTGAYVIRKTENCFALTNYCINNGHKEACHRRDVAYRYLQAKKTFGLDDIKDILERSAQKLPNNLISNYSMALNLKTATINLYYRNDFTTTATLSLADELKKGKHHADIAAYFPASIAPVIEQEFKQNGIDAAIGKYKALRETGSDAFNFKNDDALNLAISWIEKGQTNEALKLLACLKEFDPDNLNIYSWLGVANRKQNNLAESDKCFSIVLVRRPDDYLATLWGRQSGQKVTFKLADFEGAGQVSLMGEFTGWTKDPIKMKKENDYWSCEVTLPKGEVIYKFLVNDQYLADSKNYMHTGTGPDVYSKLYVW